MMNGNDNNDPGGCDDGFDSRKHTLAIRLQQRRPRQVLADQGIIPPLNTPGTFFERRQRLQRAIKEDYLNKAIQDRPDRKYLVEKHILEDTAVSNTIVASQKNLKKAKLVDDLNEKILFRPGVIELVEKNIIPADNVQQALRGGQLQYKKIADFIEDDSSDAFSPEQPPSVPPPPPPPPTCSPPIVFPLNSTTTQVITTLASSTSADKIYVPSKSKVSIGKSSSSSSVFAQASSHHPYLNRQSSKGSKSNLLSSSRNSSSRKKKEKPKVRKFKYHQYVPPDQGKNSGEDKLQPSLDADSPYQRLLEQQQIYLQYQIMQNQYGTAAAASHAGQRSKDQASTGSFGQQTLGQAVGSPSSMPMLNTMKLECRNTTAVAVTSGQQVATSRISKLTTNKLDEMKVSELKEELKARGLKVTGTKEVLIERLKPHCIQTNESIFGSLPDIHRMVGGDDNKTTVVSGSNANTTGVVNNKIQFDTTTDHTTTSILNEVEDQSPQQQQHVLLNNLMNNHHQQQQQRININDQTVIDETTFSSTTAQIMYPRKISRMPAPEQPKLVPKPEKLYTLPTWNINVQDSRVVSANQQQQQRKPPAQVVSLTNGGQQQQQAAPPNGGGEGSLIDKDKMLMIQQKEIDALKRVVEYHELNMARMQFGSKNSDGGSILQQQEVEQQTVVNNKQLQDARQDQQVSTTLMLQHMNNRGHHQQQHHQQQQQVNNTAASAAASFPYNGRNNNGVIHAQQQNNKFNDATLEMMSTDHSQQSISQQQATANDMEDIFDLLDKHNPGMLDNIQTLMNDNAQQQQQQIVVVSNNTMNQQQQQQEYPPNVVITNSAITHKPPSGNEQPTFQANNQVGQVGFIPCSSAAAAAGVGYINLSHHQHQDIFNQQQPRSSPSIINQQQQRVNDKQLNNNNGASNNELFVDGRSMHDMTKILLETSGDALMDTSNFPIKITNNNSGDQMNDNPNMTLPYSRPSTCSSTDSGIMFNSSRFSPPGGGTESCVTSSHLRNALGNSREQLLNDRLSSSSLESGEQTLNSATQQQRLLQNNHCYKPLMNGGVQRHHQQQQQFGGSNLLVKAASQELLSASSFTLHNNASSNADTMSAIGGNHTTTEHELNWLDLGSSATLPASSPPFDAFPLDASTGSSGDLMRSSENLFDDFHDCKLPPTSSFPNTIPSITSPSMMDMQWTSNDWEIFNNDFTT